MTNEKNSGNKKDESMNIDLTLLPYSLPVPDDISLEDMVDYEQSIFN